MNCTCRPLLLFCIGLAQATPLFAAGPAPADPSAPAPAATYDSAFDGYRAHGVEPLADWRAMNDEVARIGGHIGILRRDSTDLHRHSSKATTPAGAQSQPPVSGAPQAPAGHAQH